MLRFRRYRVFIVFAVFTVAGLYYFTSLNDWERASEASVEGLKNFAHKGATSAAEVLAVTSIENRKDAEAQYTSVISSELSILPTSLAIIENAKTQSLQFEQTSQGQSTSSGNLSSPTTVSRNYVQAPPTLTSTTTTGTKTPQIISDPAEDSLAQEGRGRHEAPPVLTSRPIIHWSSMSEHFPIPPESIIPIPTGKSKPIPRIQYEFKDESPSARIDRERKLASVKESFKHSWAGYREYAWLQDELSPISGKSRNPFCGWAATLVDSLDTLWIMDMKEAFEEAALAVGEIDFTTSIRQDIPLFETTIRYLGGLVSAYDLSGGKYTILLDKAVELAEVLMGAFDTPNRMPIMYYYWKPTFASNPHRAGTRAVLAEIGSLSMEFTRLAQITKEAKYYDAIARITNEFEAWQNNTQIPGLWPKSVDTSGCKKVDVMLTTPIEMSLLNGPGFAKAAALEAVMGETENDNMGGTVKATKGGQSDFHGADDHAIARSKLEMNKRQLEIDSLAEEASQTSDSLPQGAVPSVKPDCEPQGLDSPPKSTVEDFTLGGMADSVYEYLPKQFMLLGGLRQEYRTMYEMAIEATNKYLLFRPMIPHSERDIRVIGSATVSGDPDVSKNFQLKAEQQHLLCFAGGMYAIGSKIFGREADMELAAKLTDGCVWAYESTKSGIMPEGFIMMPCENSDSCEWNQTRWEDELDPYRATREQQVLFAQEQARLRLEKENTSGEATTGVQQVDHTSVAPVHTSEASQTSIPTSGPLAKRQLGAIENDPLSTVTKPADDIIASFGKPFQQPNNSNTQNLTSTKPVVPAYVPPPLPSHEDVVAAKIKNEGLPIGITSISSTKYILRPEAIESVFIMYRITGDESWREKGWTMFTAIQNSTQAEFGNTAIGDVTRDTPVGLDEMESFWLAETLKYFYLLFSDPSLISLDDYVLNTEAHPFKRLK